MDREKLISYSHFYMGEYDKIIKAIKTDEDVEIVDIPNAITMLDSEYPRSLFNLKYPPLVIYYKGNIDLLNGDNNIAIVGSRNACEYALNATKALCNANKDKTIISGLAKGIDACAHENATSTIGILGCGIDYIYPRCNYDLFTRIEKEGLIISEYPGYSKPLGYHFPFRNRMIACLANKVYVMQSNLKSGTMTTINEALELGKEVKVLPYDIFNEYGTNNNHLIYEGANIIENEEIVY